MRSLRSGPFLRNHMSLAVRLEGLTHQEKNGKIDDSMTSWMASGSERDESWMLMRVDRKYTAMAGGSRLVG